MANGRTFQIINSDEEIFMDKCSNSGSNAYISYRNVICRALFQTLKKLNNKDKREILKKEYFDKIHNACSNCKSEEVTDFLSLYFSEINKNKKVAFLVDATDGCFPLMFSSENNRIPALENALSNLNTKWNEIMSVLESSKESSWCKKIETNLDEYYDCPKNTVKID